ncbi:signal peptidase I [Herbiconiux solani]|uniref:signal peptidase I n=1 Tax=Herbiconiux solani TaxID=661329 RepID=UPI000824B0E4|nr:signal peptidase I [Herbiconiux solani]
MSTSTTTTVRHRPSLRDATVTTVGTLGILAVVWLLVSWIFSLSVIVFVTGSMAPTMPTGTGAVIQTVPASELRVGDVVTVPRSLSGTPVTHRIVAIDEVAGVAEQRSLTLKGDDNERPDRQQYVVAEAGRVLVAVPGAGTVVAWLKSPIAMVGITVAVAAIAAWAFWPTRHDRPTRRDRRARPRH